VGVLDDYLGVALLVADWGRVRVRASVDSFRERITDRAELVRALAPYDVVVLMRVRTPMPATVIEALPRLRLLVTTGRRNAAIDVEAARARGIVVSGTESSATAPVELTWALILGLARRIVVEDRNLRDGGWQTTVGRGLSGRTLGVLGLGRIGTRVAAVGRAFGMEVIGWSPHLTPERAADAGARAVPLDELLRVSDVVTVHLVEGEPTRGLLGAAELAAMKPDALLVNTSRGPIVDQAALMTALERGHLGGVGLDVYDEEPLPADHPLRSAPRTLLTPHLGYVTEDLYRTFFTQVVEDVVAFLDGAPVRQL
jgi:phosphoglycerate dehydrogenase-like enzyme